MGVLVIAASLGAVACASPGLPPGGPARVVPPRLVAITPEPLAVNVRPRAVEFTFDEVVNEASRGSGAAAGIGGGATGLESLVLVSPRNGSVAVNWGRERLSVRPRRGFRPNSHLHDYHPAGALGPAQQRAGIRRCSRCSARERRSRAGSCRVWSSIG